MSRRAAFTLIELLVVCGIIGVLLILVAPAVSTIGRASAITTAGSTIVDQLNLGRQTALTQNRMVEVRFFRLKDETSDAEAFRALGLYLYDEAGRSTSPLGKIIHLPSRVIAMDSEEHSTLLNEVTNKRGKQEEIVPGLNDKVVQYQSFRFRPGGSTDLSPNGASNGDKWFLSVKSENDLVDGEKPAVNYMTVMLDPVSGRVRVFRP